MNEHAERERYFDDELAALTDRILAQPEPTEKLPEEPAEYAAIVRDLYAVLHEEPPAALRQRLDQRLEQEWTRHSTQPTARRMRFSPVMRMVAAAAVLVVAISTLTLLAPPDAVTIQGTAAGELGAGIALGLGLLIAISIVVWVVFRRR